MVLLTLNGGGFESPLAQIPESLEMQFADLSEILREVAEEVILPAFGKHYDASGLKTHSRVLKQALTEEGAKGNILTVGANQLSVGISYEQVPYAEAALEGRKAFSATKKKALRFYDSNGKAIFVKSVKASPPHPVVFLTQNEFDQIAVGVTQRLLERGAQALPK